MAGFREYQSVKLTQRHRGADVYLGGEIHDLAIGQVGTVIALLGGGTAFEVEFELRAPRFGASGELLDAGSSCTVTLTPDQVAPAS